MMHPALVMQTEREFKVKWRTALSKRARVFITVANGSTDTHVPFFALCRAKLSHGPSQPPEPNFQLL